MIIMKKHILSDILVNSELSYGTDNSGSVNGVISETATIEDSTPDEFYTINKGKSETRSVENSLFEEYEFGVTNLTKSLESSDADEFVMEATILTENVENSDVDEIILTDSTRKTFAVEDTDADEFENIYITDSYNEDFDDILFI